MRVVYELIDGQRGAQCRVRYYHLLSSLRSKRFRGVFCTKTPIFVFFWTRAKWGESENKEEGGGERRRRKPPLLYPRLPFYFALVPISADQTAKNATEMLATQAISYPTSDMNGIIVLLKTITKYCYIVLISLCNNNQ